MKLWSLRLLTRSGAFERWVDNEGWPSMSIVSELPVASESVAELDVDPARDTLNAELEKLERDPPSWRDAGLPARNIGWLGDSIQLSDLERQVLLLSILAVRDSLLAICVESIATSEGGAVDLVACALAVDPDEVVEVLRPDAPLRSIGLIRESTDLMFSADGSFEPAPEMIDLLHRDFASPSALMAEYFVPAAASTLELDDFEHIRTDLGHVVSILHGALTQRAEGVNILIHGPPGTGKTALASVLAQALEADAFRVKVEDDEDDGALTGTGRLAAYRICQRVLRCAERTFIVFDECDDVYSPVAPGIAMFLGRRPYSTEKGWMTKLLEENKVPCVWIGNHVRAIDPAVLRRFTIVLEMPPAPVAARKKMVAHHVGELDVSESWIEAISADDRLAPGLIERAAFAGRLAALPRAEDTEKLMGAVLESHYRAQGKMRKELPSRMALGVYDPSLLRTGCDLERVVQGLDRVRRGNVLLYGPPGTGKTAFVSHLAERLGVQVVVRRGSDLLSKWVGDTEKRIAAMFDEASRTGAMLLLDEADGFLRDRAGAMRSWEVTQVNELLVRMELFEGIFVCATNLVEALDEATFRRFALAMRFDPPAPEQRWALLVAALRRLEIEPPDDPTRVRRHLDSLSELTPGDFAAVVRREELLGSCKTAEAVVHELERACQLKNRGANQVGFRRV